MVVLDNGVLNGPNLHLDDEYNSSLLENNGVNVIPSTKKFHPIYNQIRELTKDINASVNILGVDEFCDLISHYDESVFDDKFFYYTEGVVDYPEENLHILNHANFCGFISHMKDSCTKLWHKYRRPVYHVNLSSREYCKSVVVDVIKSRLSGDQCITFLSSSTYLDDLDTNFANRGGLEINALMGFLLDSNFNVQLRHRGSQGFKTAKRYGSRIQLVGKLNNQDFDEFLLSGDFYLLPAKQVHASSLSHALSYGLIPVVSDGWGMDEYCHGFNSLTLKESFPEEFLKLYYNRDQLVQMRLNCFNYYMTNLHSDSHRISIKHIIESTTNG